MVQILRTPRNRITPKQFGAYGDTRSLSNTSITNGTQVVTNTTDAPFQKSDIGASIWLLTAGASSAVLAGTVTAYTSASQITISATAGTTQTNGRCVIGHDDTAAITAALNYVFPKAGYNGGSSLFLSDGHYLTGPQTVPTGASIVGAGAFQSMFYLKPGSATSNKYLLRNRTSNANRQSYEDFGLNGLREFHRAAGTLPNDIDVLRWGPDPDNLTMYEGGIYNSYRNLFITEACRAGLRYAGIGPVSFSDIKIIQSSYGFDINGSGAVFNGCSASAFAAAWVLGSSATSNRFATCRGYLSGYGTEAVESLGAGNYCNWYLNGATDNDFVGCSGKESWGSNWLLAGAKQNSFTSCRASDPGCVYTGHSLGSDNAAVTRAGWHLTGVSSDNRFQACSTGIGSHSTTSYATHAVLIEGTGDYNVGDIYADQGVTWATGIAVDDTASTHNSLKVNGSALT